MKANANIAVGSYIVGLCGVSLTYVALTKAGIDWRRSSFATHNTAMCERCNAIAEWARVVKIKTRKVRGWFVEGNVVIRDMRHSNSKAPAPSLWAFVNASLESKAKYEEIKVKAVPNLIGVLALFNHTQLMILEDAALEGRGWA